MKKPGIVFYCFLIISLAQIIVPSVMIARYEMILRTGVPFKFTIQPYDPVDLFRGRYVSINLMHQLVPVPKGIEIKENSRVYAILGTDKKGYAKVVSISLKEPKNVPYVYCGAFVRDNAYAPAVEDSKNREIKEAEIEFPFTVYYMNEYKAKRAEEAYWRRDRKKESFILVRVKWGKGVVSRLVINGKDAEKITEEDVKESQQ